MRKANVLSAILILYLGVIAAIAYPRYEARGEWMGYFAIILGQLGIIFLLRFFTIRRDKMLRDRTRNSPHENISEK